MDVTVLFKACVKTVRTTNRALDGVTDQKHQNLLSKPRRGKDANLAKARDIVKQISSLQSFLSEHKAAYLNVINYLSTNKTMTEVDRERVDTTAQDIINNCTKMINDYKKEVHKYAALKQTREHYENVITSVEQYLKSVSKSYTEAKAIRVKRVIETHKLSKLETCTSNNNSLIKNHKVESTPKQLQKTTPHLPLTPPVEHNIEEEISPEEMQMFESENELLYNDLNSMSDEVKHMESKVVHIAELQELFTEKVLQQEKDIERIATTVVNSTDNMKDANEQIKQTIQRNAGLRVWILFFLLVMSFSLLFLDWYND